MLRSILIFPKVSEITTIQNIRRELDPLYPHIRPHITLVFPFESEATDEVIIQNIQTILKPFSAFKVTFENFSSDEKSYLWLPVDEGCSVIQKMHDVLYQSPLFSPFLRPEFPYTPHITVGQIHNQQAILSTLKVLNSKQLQIHAEIDTVSIEHILDNDDSDEFFQITLFRPKK